MMTSVPESFELMKKNNAPILEISTTKIDMKHIQVPCRLQYPSLSKSSPPSPSAPAPCAPFPKQELPPDETHSLFFRTPSFSSCSRMIFCYDGKSECREEKRGERQEGRGGRRKEGMRV